MAYALDSLTNSSPHQGTAPHSSFYLLSELEAAEGYIGYLSKVFPEKEYNIFFVDANKPNTKETKLFLLCTLLTSLP